MASGKKLANVLFVINPISGDIEKKSVKTEIRNFCEAHQITSEFFKTTGNADAENLKAAIREHDYDAVFAVGGDGTVHLVASVLINTHLPMGIIPMGSGNGLSKDLNIPQDLEGSLKALVNNQLRDIDTLLVNDHISVHLSDLGFNALVVKLFSEGEKRGPGAYAFLALQEFLNYEPSHYKIETDVGCFFGPAFMVTLTNAKAFGSNATINPTGIIDDGQFEICLLEPFPKTAALGILYRLYHETILASDYSRIIRCRQATIYNLSGEVAHVDGEPVELGEKVTVEVLPRSLTLLLPEGSAAGSSFSG